MYSVVYKYEVQALLPDAAKQKMLNQAKQAHEWAVRAPSWSFVN
jgi:hypothetical protein